MFCGIGIYLYVFKLSDGCGFKFISKKVFNFLLVLMMSFVYVWVLSDDHCGVTGNSVN